MGTAGSYDVIVIGGGHNGLVAATRLARSGLDVLVVEARSVLGGGAATEECFPGCRVDTGAEDAATLHPAVVKDLGLDRRLRWIDPPACATSLLDGDRLTLWRNPRRTLAEIERFSRRDAARFIPFTRFVAHSAKLLRAAIRLTPPPLFGGGIAEFLPWLAFALKARGLDGREMMAFLRVLPMSVREFLDEWFEGAALKGLLAAPALTGRMAGPFSGGTALSFLLHHLNAREGEGYPCRFVAGGMGTISEVLAQEARGFGAQVLCGRRVRRILLEEGNVRGVVLDRGEEITARVVTSSADPKVTFLDLVGARHLPLRFVRALRNIRYLGVTARLAFLLDGAPDFGEGVAARQGGHIVLAPDLCYLERAYDDAKYGRFSENPLLDVVIPSLTDPSRVRGREQLLSVTMHYAPYRLREGHWDDLREVLAERVVAHLARHDPRLPEKILARHVITPLDFERDYLLTEGHIFQGQTDLDQLFVMRPVGGYGRYRTPVRGLYLCGAGAPPGGGVTGLPGFNASREILHDLRTQRG